MNLPALSSNKTVIEFTNLTPDSAEWSFGQQKENKPRLGQIERMGRITRMGIATQQVTESHQLRGDALG